LASLLPGVRELRAPLASGLLWLTVLYLSAPHVFEEFNRAPTVSAALTALGSAGIAGTVILGALAYLFGLTAQGVITPASALAGRTLFAPRSLDRLEPDASVR
jgi:hypothetical protein